MSIIFNMQAPYADIIESYGLCICEYEASQEIIMRLNTGATFAECLPLVKLVFMRRNGTFRCSALYDGDINLSDIAPGFFDSMTAAEKLCILDPTFSVRSYYQKRADLFYFGVINSPRIQIAQKADARLSAILANWRGELERSAMQGPHGFVPLSMPKGRKQRRASGIDTAIKETSEETGILPSNIITTTRTSLTIDYVDDGHRYNFKFYPALLKKPHVLTLDRSRVNMFDEVTDIFYANKEELFAYDTDPLTKKIYLDNFDKFGMLVIHHINTQRRRTARSSRTLAYNWVIKKHLNCAPSKPDSPPQPKPEQYYYAATDDEAAADKAVDDEAVDDVQWLPTGLLDQHEHDL